MTNFRKIITTLLSLLLVFALASCGGEMKPCESCVDENYDGICDACEKEIPKEKVEDVPLFRDGYPTFQVVLGKNVSSDVRQTAVSSIKSMLRQSYDVGVDLFYEESENDDEMDIEILIGGVTSRGERYFVDGHSLGKKGYLIRIVDKKILINAGSDEMLSFAITSFAENVLMKEDITDLLMTEDDVTVKVQTDYKVTAIKLDGADMRGYTIATDLTDKTYKSAALMLQDSFYSVAGYWLDLIDIENATERSVVITHVDGIRGEESFKVSGSGESLVISSAFDNMTEEALLQFLLQRVDAATGELDFHGTVYTQDISVVYYDDFGAKGDGKTDDFFAIYNAHVFANECGQTVKASREPEGKVYYIHDTTTDKENSRSSVSVPIRTNTDWQNVKFIIDDSYIPTFKVTSATDPTVNEPGYDALEHERYFYMGDKNIFSILPNKEHEVIKLKTKSVLEGIVADGLGPNTTRIDLKIDGWDGDLMIVPYSSAHKVYRRIGNYGQMQSRGTNMHEIIVIDREGNVSPETPIMFDYTSLDYVLVYKLDPTSAVTVKNADILTVEPRVKNERYDTKSGKKLFSTGYISRGIGVERSFTVVENIRHDTTGGFTLKERVNGLESCNYTGMFQAKNASYVTFRDCVMHGKQQYDGHSSYDIYLNAVNKIVFENCKQQNFWITVDPEEGIMHEHAEYVDGAYPSTSDVKIYDAGGELQKIGLCWSIASTSYCKNMEYIGCRLSHYDTHSGLYNGKIIDSEINTVTLLGHGEFIMENVKCYQREAYIALIRLREDMGYSWDGNVVIKDTRAYIFDIEGRTLPLTLFGFDFTNFYFGYKTSFPNVTIDNLDVYSTVQQKPISGDYTINFFKLKETAKNMHIDGDTGENAIFGYIDADGDGYIDEPLFDLNRDGTINESDLVDFDGDTRVGNTRLKYSDYGDIDSKTLNEGIIHPTCTRNQNVVRPPEYLKVINNDGADGKGGYVYKIVNTAGRGISDGGWYRDADSEDTMGGFFGNTRFYYGLGEDDFFLGTDHVGQTVSATFKFINDFYP